jgi:hypothetical protein
MKTNWKPMAASLAVFVGISGLAFGQDRNDHRDGDRDKRARVENHDGDHDRDNRYRNNRRVFVPDNRRGYNNGWYGNRDHDRGHDRDRVLYNGRIYSGGSYSRY